MTHNFRPYVHHGSEDTEKQHRVEGGCVRSPRVVADQEADRAANTKSKSAFRPSPWWLHLYQLGHLH